MNDPLPDIPIDGQSTPRTEAVIAILRQYNITPDSIEPRPGYDNLLFREEKGRLRTDMTKAVRAIPELRVTNTASFGTFHDSKTIISVKLAEKEA